MGKPGRKHIFQRIKDFFKRLFYEKGGEKFSPSPPHLHTKIQQTVAESETTETIPSEKVLEKTTVVSFEEDLKELDVVDHKVLTKSLSPKKLEEKQALVNIGIDFGTSSTKVFLKEILTGKTHAFAFSDYIDIFGPYCWPSTLCEDKGRLYFGLVAERKIEGRHFRSFKVCLACKNGCVGSNKCVRRQCEIGEKQVGFFKLSIGRNEKILLKSWHLVALYIASLINEVSSNIIRDRLFGKSLKLTFNMAAPLDMLNDPLQEYEFNVILYLAESISAKITQGILVEEAKKIIENAWKDFNGLPGEDIRKTFLVPETHAATMGYLVNGKAEPGLYAAIDIGAGTTDIAIFRHCSDYAIRDFAYYYAATNLVGGDNIDESVLAIVSGNRDLSDEHKAHLLAEIRKAKHTFIHAEELSIGNVKIKPNEFLNSIEPTLERILHHYTMTWGKAYEKEQNPNSWRELNLFLLGGCNNLPYIRNQVLRHNPASDFCSISSLARNIHMSKEVLVYGHSDKLLSSFSNLLMVAHGLSFHIGEIKSFFKPKEVSPLRRHVKTKKVDPNYTGHWW